ncbi:MAG TPA: FkbM family methyltransferase [Methylomirabilota bacterium]|nr:FkbM family methyltransferase [Methylomirabilota bacterium]
MPLDWKEWLAKRNIRVYRNTLPKGCDLFFDLERHGLSAKVRTILDIGGNTGQFAALCRGRVPHADVWSFEPVKSTHEKLSMAGKQLGFRTFHLGMGAERARLPMHLSANSRYNSLNPQITAEPSSIVEEVEIQRIDEFCHEHQIQEIGLLKTDTEGHDLQVLEGAAKLFEANRVLLVLCEVGFARKDDRHTPFVKALPALQEHGFELFGFYNQGAWGPGGAMDYADALFLNTRKAGLSSAPRLS